MRAHNVTSRKPRPFCDCGAPTPTLRARICQTCKDARLKERKRVAGLRRYHQKNAAMRKRSRDYYARNAAKVCARSAKWKAEHHERYNELCAGYAWKRRIKKRFGKLPDAKVMEMLAELRKFIRETGWRDVHGRLPAQDSLGRFI